MRARILFQLGVGWLAVPIAAAAGSGLFAFTVDLVVHSLCAGVLGTLAGQACVE